MQQVTCSKRDTSTREDREGEEEIEEEWGQGGGRKLHYYLKVMGLFEQVSCPLAVLDIANKAVRQADDHDPLCVSSFESKCALVTMLLLYFVERDTVYLTHHTCTVEGYICTCTYVFDFK